MLDENVKLNLVDIFLRAHTVAPKKRRSKSSPTNGPKWPDQCSCSTPETTIDTRQELTFGAYWLCELANEAYICSEEGLFYHDDLDRTPAQSAGYYVGTEHARVEVKTLPAAIGFEVIPALEICGESLLEGH